MFAPGKKRIARFRAASAGPAPWSRQDHARGLRGLDPRQLRRQRQSRVQVPALFDAERSSSTSVTGESSRADAAAEASDRRVGERVHSSSSVSIPTTRRRPARRLPRLNLLLSQPFYPGPHQRDLRDQRASFGTRSRRARRIAPTLARMSSPMAGVRCTPISTEPRALRRTSAPPQGSDVTVAPEISRPAARTLPTGLLRRAGRTLSRPPPPSADVRINAALT